MSERSASSTGRHQVLADPSGRRRRRLVIAGRVATAALGLWLVTLTLGGLGLQPLAGLPVVGDLGTGPDAPPALPERVRAAVGRGTTVVPLTTPAAPAQRAPSGVQSPRRSATTTAPARTRTPSRKAAGKTTATPTTTAPATPPVTPATTPAPAAAHAPAKPTTSPSTTAPGKTQTPPGKTKTAPGPPATTPGTTTPGTGGNGKANDHRPTRTTP